MGKNEHIKMPSVKERCLRKILPVGMAVALAGSAIAGPVAAFAATTHTYDAATITITGSAAGADETFDAYKIFNADIAVDAVTAQDTASHIEWASSAAQTATLAFLDSLTGAESYSTWLTTKGYTQTGAHDNAQNAAEFIAEMIANDGAATGFASVDGTTASGTETVSVKTAGSFTDRFARAIEGSAMTVSATSTTAGVISGVTEGYFLVVTTPSTIGADEAGSAPMFVPFGGSITTLQAKEAAPGVTFQVKEDKTDTFGGAADSNKDQDLVYKIVGTLPANINAYNSYHDNYVITLPAGLSTAMTSPAAENQDVSSVVVKLNGTTVTSDVSVSATGRIITVNIADIKALAAAQNITLDGTDEVEIDYQAHINADGVMGSTGQQTTMTRTYTEDPVGEADQAATTLHVTNFAYQTTITKLDKTTHLPLADAGFYITAETDAISYSSSNFTAIAPAVTASAGDTLYVQADGSLGTTAYEFVTGADGTFNVPELDEGVYTIHENTVPSSYQAPVSDAVLTITSSLDPSTQTITYVASVTGGEQAEVDGDYSTQLTASTPATGLAEVQIVNEKEFAMPYTGLKGNTGLYVAAFALGIGGATAVAVGMRRRREDDQD